MAYDVTPLRAPSAMGGRLRMLAALADNRLTGGVVVKQMLASAGVKAMRAAAVEAPCPVAPPSIRPPPGGAGPNWRSRA